MPAWGVWQYGLGLRQSVGSQLLGCYAGIAGFSALLIAIAWYSQYCRLKASLIITSIRVSLLV